MKRFLQLLIGLLLVLLIVLSMFVLGFAFSYRQITSVPTAETAVPEKLPLAWEAWGLIKQRFYGDIPSSQTVVHGMIKGMLASLDDPHTILVEPEPAQIEQNNLAGSYGGIGARVESNDGFIVLLPFAKGPAAAAGILPNDILLKIDDKDLTTNMTIQDIEVLLRGDIGSSVTLTLHRTGQNQAIVVALKREKIDIPSVEYRMLPNTKLGYIHISLESSDTAKEFEDALKALGANNPTGLVLDLRNNPGGIFPDPVRSIAGQFLPAKTTVVLERYRDGHEEAYTTTGNQLAKDKRLVVLINSGTASAAEVLAGALQDAGRAVLVGEKSFGKGSVQSLRTLTDKSVLHITTAIWFTPKHNQIEGEGLKPDFAVPLTPDDTAKGKDPQLERAVEYLQTGK